MDLIIWLRIGSNEGNRFLRNVGVYPISRQGHKRKTLLIPFLSLANIFSSNLEVVCCSCLVCTDTEVILVLGIFCYL